MSAFVDRVRAQAEARAAARRQEIADLLRAALPGVRSEAEGDVVRLSGRGVARRWGAIRGDHLLRSHWP